MPSKIIIFDESKAPKSDTETVKSEDVFVTPKEFAWEYSKENILPISQGRKIDALMESLPTGVGGETSLLKNRIDDRKKELDEELEKNKDDLDKQLDLWYVYIDWLEQNVPDGGKVSGLTAAIETCIEKFYDVKKLKQDKRLFDVFMKFKRFCDEPTEIFHFMYANSICTLLAQFYLNWSWQLEMKKNMTRAHELIKLGLKNLATPREALTEAESQIKLRIERMILNGDLDEVPTETSSSGARRAQRDLDNSGIRAALQTLKFSVGKKGTANVPINRVDAADQNVGGLKSQSKLVNGVKVVPKKVAPSASGSRKPRNHPIGIFSENEELMPIDENGDENSSVALRQLMRKVPTSQRVQAVGRVGQENQPLRSSILRR